VFSTALPSEFLPQRSVEPRQQSRPRCRFCNGRGHEESQCRKRQGLEIRQVGQTECYTLAIQRMKYLRSPEATDYLGLYIYVPSHHPPPSLQDTTPTKRGAREGTARRKRSGRFLLPLLNQHSFVSGTKRRPTKEGRRDMLTSGAPQTNICQTSPCSLGIIE
jgi:hypothetical protein